MDDTAGPAFQLACALLHRVVVEARDGSADDRAWLLSPEGADWLAGVGVNPEAAWARLVDAWAQGGLRRMVIERAR